MFHTSKLFPSEFAAADLALADRTVCKLPGDWRLPVSNEISEPHRRELRRIQQTIPMMKPSRRFLWKGLQSSLLAPVVWMTFAACADDVVAPSQAKANSAEAGFARAPAPNAAVAGGAASELATSTPDIAPSNADQIAKANAAAVVTPTMVIRNGTASLEVDSLELAIVAVRKLAASMGGYVGNTTQTTGSNMVRSADVELKIPSERYDAAVGNLAPIGKLESQTSTAEDVGEEFFDVSARQTNAHRLEERLITLLATRTGKLDDVLAVERELARVREEIERYEGRLRYLKSHVSTSTLMVNLHEKRSVVSGYNGTNIIAESFRNAWRNFVQFIALLISSLGWLIPLAVVLVAGVLVAKRLQGTAKPTSLTKGKARSGQAPEK